MKKVIESKRWDAPEEKKGDIMTEEDAKKRYGKLLKSDKPDFMERVVKYLNMNSSYYVHKLKSEE